MRLSNYLLQALVWVPFYYGYGLGIVCLSPRSLRRRVKHYLALIALIPSAK